MSNEEIISRAVYLSMKNREAVEKSEQCGCYHCLSVFESKDIADWTDNNQTALCPNCAVDTVIPDVSDIKVLEASQKYWL